MLLYYLKCTQKTESKNPRVAKANKGNLIIFIKMCSVLYKKKSRFIKKQEASGLLSSSGIKTPLN